MPDAKKGFVLPIIIIILVAAIVAGFVLISLRKPSNQFEESETVEQTEVLWQEKGVVIAGQYADADVVDLGGGQYRMYYSIEPEVLGNKLEVFSATSKDGVNWQKEEGVRKEFATFPDVVKLADGGFRMYFQNAGVVKSALSENGLIWIDEPGVRVDKSEEGFNLENVGAQSTIRLDDGTFVMLYRGTINQPYKVGEKLPNQDTHLYFWATSKDGLTFKKNGLAIDSRNDTLLGAADGAEWVRWNLDELRVYFWGYAGVYYVVYQDDSFSKPVFVFTNSKDKMIKFPPNPPGDPTLTKINGQWFMYYGQHTKGIYYATYQR